MLLVLFEFAGAAAGAVIQAASNPMEGMGSEGGAGGRKEEKDGNGAVAGGVEEKENGSSAGPDMDATGAREGDATAGAEVAEGGGGDGAAGSASWKSSHSWSSTTASNAAIREAMSSLLAAESTTGLLVNVGMEEASVMTGTGSTGIGPATVCGAASKDGGDEGIIVAGGSVASTGAAGDSVSVGMEGRGGVCIAMADVDATIVGLAGADAGAGAMRRGGS